MRAKQVWLIVSGVILLTTISAVGITWKQAFWERKNLSADLERRTALLAEGLKESVEPNFVGNSTASLQKIVDKFANRERLVGLAVIDNKGNKVAGSADLPSRVLGDSRLAGDSMDSDKPLGSFIQADGKNFYSYALPLHDAEARVVGALLVVQNADYIHSGVRKVWEDNLLRFLTQLLIFGSILGLLVWWILVRPLVKVAESVRSARIGRESGRSLSGIEEHAFFKPLIGEISKMTKSLYDARSSASEEARMRLEKLDTPWTAERLKEFIKAHLKDRQIFLVSNREPYIHNKVKNQVSFSVPASGVVTALEPVMQACGGTWIAHGSGNADKETADQNGKLLVPPDDPKYTLKRVWLSPKEVQGHYVGFSNEALWPLCHMAHTRPIFRKEDWSEFRRVNNRFAQTLLTEIKNVERPLILVQDFHFALLPGIVKASRPDAQICLFWHIPWPSAESFSICPWRKEIVSGMLGSDIVGFHTQQYCNNFIDTVSKEVESLIDLEQFSITKDDHKTFIKPFPISIAFTSDSKSVSASSAKSPDRTVLEKLGAKTKYLGLGVDRLDYTKGIMERFKGVEVLLDNYPEYRGQFTFLQIAPISREGAEKYREYGEKVTAEAERINEKFKSDGWKPVILEKKHYSHEALNALYRLANVCLVTSLHDGMNLVAKEFAAARDDGGGVLILSHFTGAARDLKGAVLVNPYSAEQVAEALHKSLTMPFAERERRLKAMRESLKNYNVYRWSAELIKALSSLG